MPAAHGRSATTTARCRIADAGRQAQPDEPSSGIIFALTYPLFLAAASCAMRSRPVAVRPVAARPGRFSARPKASPDRRSRSPSWADGLSPAAGRAKPRPCHRRLLRGTPCRAAHCAVTAARPCGGQTYGQQRPTYLCQADRRRSQGVPQHLHDELHRFTVIAIIAHFLVWLWRPWLPGPKGYALCSTVHVDPAYGILPFIS